MILRSFLRGLLFVVPVGLTVYLLYWCAVKIDALPRQWFDLPLPGLGIAFTVAAITAVGFLGSSVLTRWIVTLMDRVFQRAPGAKLIYGAVKDLMEAFVGEKKKFSKPVLVSLGDDAKGEILGFITREEAAWLGRKDSVVVYFPQSYNFAGNLALFPRERVTVLDAEPAAVMQFIVSGGVSEAR